jgi:hypothetical protein
MAEPGYDFTKETAERIVRAVREVESRPRPSLGIKPPVHFGEPIPVWVRNDGPATSDVIPAYGVAAVVGSTFDNGYPTLIVSRPSTEFRRMYVANGPIELAKDDHGLAYWGDNVIVRYTTTEPTSALFAYGPVPGLYELDAYRPQCSESYGIAFDVTGSSDDKLIHASMHPIERLIVQNSSQEFTSTFLNTRDMQVYYFAGSGGPLTATSWTVPVHCFGDSIAADKYIVVHEVNGHWVASHAGSTSGSTSSDVLLAVDSSNVGMYASTLFSPWNEGGGSTQYEVNKDLEVEFEPQGTTPNQSVRGFIDSNAYPSYNAGAVQLLGKSAADAITWLDYPTTGTPSADEKLAATSDSTGAYWSVLHANYNGSTVFTNGKDWLVESEASGVAPNQQIGLFIDLSDINNFDGTKDQLSMHDSSGFTVWRTLADQVYVATFDVSGDVRIKFETTASNLMGFWDASTISGYNSTADQFLANSSGLTKWTTQTAVDEKLAASSENSGVFWNQLHADVNGTSVFVSTADLKVETEIFGTTPDQTIKLFVDVSDIANYSTSAEQYLTNSSGITEWTTFPIPDEKLAASSENVGVYWNQLHDPNDVNGSSVFVSTADLRVETEIFGTTPNQTVKLFVDVSDIANYSTSAEQYLTNSSGITEWTTFPLTDEKLAASSENVGVYWNQLHDDINGTSVYNSTQDLRVETEIFGTTPNQTIKLFVDASDISGWVQTNRQVLSHTSGGGLEWLNVSTCT